MANEQNLIPFTGADDPRRGHKKKGSKHLSTYIQEMLTDESITFKIRKEPKGETEEFKGAPIKAIIAVAIYRSMLGDKDAREWLAKHGYGTKLVVETGDPVEEALAKLGLLNNGGEQKNAGETKASESETS